MLQQRSQWWVSVSQMRSLKVNTKEADSRNKILSLNREEENYLKASFRIVSHERGQNSL